MKVTKSTIHKITVQAPCSCVTTREFEDSRFSKPIGKTPIFTACKKHKDKADVVDMLEMLLNSRLEEATKEAPPLIPVSRELVSESTEIKIPLRGNFNPPANHRPSGGPRLVPKTTNMAGSGAGAGKVSSKALLVEKEIELNTSGDTSSLDAELASADLGPNISAEALQVAKEDGETNLLDALLSSADREKP